MKKILLLIFTFSLLFMALPSHAIKPAPRPVTEEAVKEMAKDAKKEWKEMSRKERKAKRKEMRKDVKSAVKAAKAAGSDTNTLLLVIIAILLPPLAMAIYDGISSRFWISLLLTLLFYVPGLIYTLVVILGDD